MCVNRTWKDLASAELANRVRPFLISTHVLSRWNGYDQERRKEIFIVHGISREQIAQEILIGWRASWASQLFYEDRLYQEAKEKRGVMPPGYITMPTKELYERIDKARTAPVHLTYGSQQCLMQPLSRRARTLPLNPPFSSEALPDAPSGRWESSLTHAIKGRGRYAKGETERFRLKGFAAVYTLPPAFAPPPVPYSAKSGLLHVLSRLGREDIVRCTRVCREWNRVLRSQEAAKFLQTCYGGGVLETFSFGSKGEEMEAEHRYVLVGNVWSEEQFCWHLVMGNLPGWRELLRKLWTPRHGQLAFSYDGYAKMALWCWDLHRRFEGLSIADIERTLVESQHEHMMWRLELLGKRLRERTEEVKRIGWAAYHARKLSEMRAMRRTLLSDAEMEESAVEEDDFMVALCGLYVNLKTECTLKHWFAAAHVAYPVHLAASSCVWVSNHVRHAYPPSCSAAT